MIFKKYVSSSDMVTAEVAFHKGCGMVVSWMHHNVSELGQAIDRLWLTAIYFGSVLTNFRSYPDLQERLRFHVSLTMAQIIVNPENAKSVRPNTGDYRLLERSASPVEKRYRTTLYRSQRDSWINRDKHSWGREDFYAPLAVLALIGSNCRDLGNDDVVVMGHWLNCMDAYYGTRQSPSEFGSSLLATAYGYQAALETLAKD